MTDDVVPSPSCGMEARFSWYDRKGGICEWHVEKPVTLPALLVGL